MIINRTNEISQFRCFSGTGSIGGIHLPDFNDKYVFSRKITNTSDSEYEKMIREQAFEDFANGKFQNQSDGFNRLMKSYVQEVSPDRKSIITDGLKEIAKNKGKDKKLIDFVSTLLEGKVIYKNTPIGESEYIEFRDKNGELVAKYSNNGWTMLNTKAETARQIEMCTIYNEAWGEAKSGEVKDVKEMKACGNQLRELPEYLQYKPAMDMLA